MTHIPANQANRHIRRLLPEHLVLPFHFGQAAIISIIQNRPYIDAIKVFREQFNLSADQVNQLAEIYNSLSKVSFTTTERANSYKTVTSTRSLLNKLTDGSSHLKIFPAVDFNLGRPKRCL